MTILLIEDEPLVARQLEKLVRQLEPDARLAGPLPSVQRVTEYLQQHPDPDLIIADIQLADGISFDVFAETAVSCPVIFTTAYDEYAIRAFKLNSIDYLLKPIDANDLKAALTKFHRWQPGGSHFQQQFRAFLHQFAGPAKAYKRRFTAHHGRQIVPVAEEQIACFCRDELIFLYTITGQKLITDYETLDELEQQTDPAVFFRANRQFLVHIRAIEGYRPHDNSKLLVTLHRPHVAEIIVSKEKAPAFRTWFEEGG